MTAGLIFGGVVVAGVGLLGIICLPFILKCVARANGLGPKGEILAGPATAATVPVAPVAVTQAPTGGANAPIGYTGLQGEGTYMGTGLDAVRYGFENTRNGFENTMGGFENTRAGLQGGRNNIGLNIRRTVDPRNTDN